jgi:hypothetical protein
VQFDAPSCNFVQFGVPSRNPCNFVHLYVPKKNLYVPQKTKGAIKIECSFYLLEGDYLKGKSCNFVQFDAPSCNFVQFDVPSCNSVRTKSPKELSLPLRNSKDVLFPYYGSGLPNRPA